MLFNKYWELDPVSEIRKGLMILLFVLISRTMANQITTESPSPTWSIESNKLVSLNTSCMDTGMEVNLHFEKPFQGIVYANNFPHIKECAHTVMDPVHTKRVRLVIPYRHCGSGVGHSKDNSGGLYIRNQLVIRHLPTIRTRYDTYMRVDCYLAPKARPDDQKVNITLDVYPGSRLKQLDQENRLLDETATYLVVKATNNGNVYNDMVVRNCIVHESKIVDDSTTLCQVTDINGCHESRILNHFFQLDTGPDELVMVSEFKDLGILSSSSTQPLFFTCGINLCEGTCDKGCNQFFSRINLYSHSVTNRIRFKPSNSAPLAPENRTIYANCQARKRWIDELN